MYIYTFRFRGLKPLIIVADHLLTPEAAAKSDCFKGDSRHHAGKHAVLELGLPTIQDQLLKYVFYVKTNPCYMGNCTLTLRPVGTLMDLSPPEHKVIENRRVVIKELWTEYNERLVAYEEGLTHAGDVISRRSLLVAAGEDVPDIIFNGYKCPR